MEGQDSQIRVQKKIVKYTLGHTFVAIQALDEINRAIKQ